MIYVVLTGDLKSSRKIKDRAKTQEKLKNKHCPKY